VPPPSSPGEAPGEPLDKRQDVTSENAMVLTAGLRAVRERIKLPWLRGDARHAMAAFALCLATACFAPVDSKAADQKESGGPWLATVAIIRNEEQPGSGVYLGSGLIITAAHLTAVYAKMSVRIAGIALPATVLKQGSAEDIDLRGPRKSLSPSPRESDSVTARGHGRMERASHGAEGLFRC
jgi:hypothetical protein